MAMSGAGLPVIALEAGESGAVAGEVPDVDGEVTLGGMMVPGGADGIVEPGQGADADDEPGPAAVLDRAPDLVSLSDFASGRILYLNPAGISLLGLRDGDDARSRTTAEFFTDVGLAQAPQVEAALTTDSVWRGRSEFRHFRTSEPIPVSIATFTVDRTDDAPAVIAAIARDLRPAARDETRLHTALATAAYRAREQQAIAALAKLAVDADLDTLLDAATQAAAALMGMDCASIARLHPDGVGADPAGLRVLGYRGPHPAPASFPLGRSSQPGYAAITAAVAICPDRDTETQFATDGMRQRGLRSGISVPIGDGTVWGVLSAHSVRPRAFTDRDTEFLQAIAAVLTAAIRRIDAETRLRHQSLHDPLTGLPNRTLAYQQLAAVLASERDREVAVLLIDLDDFKTVNDSLGHDSGDRALISLAHRLERSVRPADTVARLGGDEFLVVCTGVDTDAALSIARRITRVLATPPTVGAEDFLPFSASIGIAVSTPAVTDAADLVRRADLAMYRAKQSGAGRHALYRRIPPER
ncbi:diguanylate cyclase domain-containing protein [Rhodococcus sp. NPDC057529]|uniref:diguanylate cyclase domain-containing protein n=1 Tax=Rhodococcus sp. NPDC057529 TaxID=3346158 RepID=UPI0036734524